MAQQVTTSLALFSVSIIITAIYISSSTRSITTPTLTPPFSHPNETMAEVKTFPPDFMWGTATASYQIEGATAEDRVPSIWDRFSATPGKVKEGHTGAVACDHYHRYRQDVQLIKNLNTKYYRFSIAWPRIQTWDSNGASVNKKGVAFYNDLINELLANDITPVATLYHWDLPVHIEDKYGGWSGKPDIAELFAEYAQTCFQEFGDRVKWWITLNEPWCSAVLGYEIGEHAPGDNDSPGVKLYLAGHNLLRAHAKAVKVYRNEFQESQSGKIGITLNSCWSEPKDRDDPKYVNASNRDMEFELGWFADPVYLGDYPASMRSRIGDRLPKFTDDEKEELKGSSDFFGLNHYSTQYATGFFEAGKDETYSYWKDKGTTMSHDETWGKTDMGWAIVPWGFANLLKYIQKRYNPDGGIIVTENGLAAKEPTVEEMEKNTMRIDYYKSYISAMHDAMTGDDAADIRGYFLWSLLDNFEWAFGYEKRFGLYWVDYETQARKAKPAVEWYSNVVKTNKIEGSPKE